jgi:hypothetical protein
LGASLSAAPAGSEGLQALIDDNNSLFVVDQSPTAETRYRVRFYFDPNSISMATGNVRLLFQGFSGSGTTQVLQLELRFQATGYELRALLVNDAKEWTSTSWIGAPLPLRGKQRRTDVLDRWSPASGLDRR